MPLIWVAEVLMAYIAIGLWIVTARDTGRRGATVWALLALIASATVLGAGFLTPGLTPVRGLVVSVIAAAILVGYRAAFPPVKPQHQKALREETRQTYLHLVLLTGAVIFMIPFVWLVSTSLKDDEDIFTTQIRLIPERPVTQTFNGKSLELVMVDGVSGVPNQKSVENGSDPSRRPPLWAKVLDNEDTITVAPVLMNNTLGPEQKVNPDNVRKVKKPGIVWENYPGSMKYLPEETHHGLVYLGNTLLITVLSIVGTLLTASMVAFSFARLRWPGRDALFILLLATMMLPYAVTMIPQFLIWEKLGFFNTLVPLWAGAFFGGGAFNIFLLRQFFMTIPSELEEAAKIDGCTYWRTFWTIMLPLVRPALATVAIMTFMGSWNNFMGPLIYISTPTKMPVAYALQLYSSVHGGEFGYLMAASTMVMIPVLIVFFFCQRYFIQGITLTGLKG